MSFQQTLNRKTRQQKIKASQRQHTAKPELQASAHPAAPAKATPAPAVNAATDDYSYIIHDLTKIGWITLICLAILAIATIFISDFPVFEQMRQTFNLPTL